MKNILLIAILIITTLCACSKKELDSSLVGKWKLIEQLVDPGDGSGVFTKIESDKTIEFFEDGKVESNGNLCIMTSDTGFTTIAKYNDTTKKFFDIECEDYFELTYKNEDGYLFLIYQCIEGCSQKYEKVK